MKQSVSRTNLRTDVESIDAREIQTTQRSDAVTQLPPKRHEVECHFDGFPFSSGTQILLSPSQ